MKNLFMLALALVMTCTFAFAASQSPYEKGKYYGEKCVKLGLEGDEDNLNILAENTANYINDYIETEEQVYSFLEGIEAGIRKACNDYGLGEEVADMLLEEFAKGFLSGCYNNRIVTSV